VYTVEEAIKIIINETKYYTKKLPEKLIFVNNVAIFASFADENQKKLMAAYWHPTRAHTATCLQKINDEIRIIKKSRADAGSWAIAWSSFDGDNSYNRTDYNTI